ncbi:hypothetical protein F5148DRAFT_831029 [Russula earlei]|uniref:Uncharacterized protein n=1 Tax=Russula earlei TaxID=71964 RepID=A0ACC0UBZ4_9AGAM|nr:hypothetical protein F5148DRAFT_831029 [Russula earlei]
MRASSIFVIFCLSIGVTPSLTLPMPCTDSEGNDHRGQLTRRQVMPNLRRRMSQSFRGRPRVGLNMANKRDKKSSLNYNGPPNTTRRGYQESPPGIVYAADAAERLIAPPAPAPAPGFVHAADAAEGVLAAAAAAAAAAPANNNRPGVIFRRMAGP